MTSPNVFTKKEIDQLYLKLQEYAYMGEETKERHVKNIKEFN